MKIYKIRRKSDGLFAEKFSYSRVEWNAKGSSYNTLAGMKAVLKGTRLGDMVRHRPSLYEIVEFELQENKTFTVKELT